MLSVDFFGGDLGRRARPGRAAAGGRPGGTGRAGAGVRAFVVLALLAGIGVAPAAHAAPTGQRASAVQLAVEKLAGDLDAPGAAVGVVELGREGATATTGVDGRGAAVTDATPFVWGSVSKSVTAAVADALLAEGSLRPDMHVQSAVPETRTLLGGTPVTVADLMHHTSGLPHDVSATDDWSRRGGALDAVRSLARPATSIAPGTYRYSSLNYLVLQAMIERVGGHPYAQTLRRTVLDPAGANGVITDPDAFERRVPPGHVPFFTEPRSIDVGTDEAGLGYGYLAGSITDLAAYARWRTQSLRDREPQSVPAGDQGNRYGPGLFREDFGGQVVWWHSGAVPGYYTFVGMVPAEGRAVVAVVNRYGELESAPIAGAGRALLALVLDRSEPSWFPAAGYGTEYTVLGVLVALAAILVSVLVLLVVRLFRGPKARGRLSTALRVAAAIVVGGGLLAACLIGAPAVVGVGLPVIGLWAPDVALLFWVVIGGTVLAVALAVAGDVLGYRRRPRTG